MRNLQAIYNGMKTRTPVPDKYRCPTCGFVRAGVEQDFTLWVKEHRPDLYRESKSWTFEGFPGPPTADTIALGCQCVAAEEELTRNRRERLSSANLPARDDGIGPRTFKNFRMVDDTLEMYQAVEHMARREGPRLLTLIGVTGCGKTHLAEAAVRASLESDRTARYDRAGDIVERLKHTFTARGEEDVYSLLDQYARVGLLIIDDIGQRAVTEWDIGQLTGLIDQRYLDGSWTLLTCNPVAGKGGIRETVEETWGARLASRMFDTRSGVGEVVKCKALDYRKRGG